jgi:hypothetical protein
MAHKTATATSSQPIPTPLLATDARGYGGPACLLLLLRAYDLIVPDVSFTLKHWRALRQDYTNAHELAALAAGFGLALLTTSIPQVADLRQYLYAERPMMTLVQCGLFPFHPAEAFGQHWILVSGFQGDTFAVRDPLLPGAGVVSVSASKLQAALVKTAEPNAVG